MPEFFAIVAAAPIPDWIANAVLIFGVLLVSLVFHEAAHAWVAYLGGDRTAYLGGQVTLNPIPHIRREPFGTVVLPLFALFMTKGQGIIGFAHAPYDPLWAARHPRRAALMAAAGPSANLLLAGIAFGIAWYLCSNKLAFPSGTLFDFLQPKERTGAMLATCRMVSTFFSLNMLLLTLNLLPLPPLDGASVLEGLFPRQLGSAMSLLRMQPFLGLAVLFLIWWYVWSPHVYRPLVEALVRLLP